MCFGLLWTLREVEISLFLTPSSSGSPAQEKLQCWLLEAAFFGRWEAGGLC